MSNCSPAPCRTVGSPFLCSSVIQHYGLSFIAQKGSDTRLRLGCVRSQASNRLFALPACSGNLFLQPPRARLVTWSQKSSFLRPVEGWQPHRPLSEWLKSPVNTQGWQSRVSVCVMIYLCGHTSPGSFWPGGLGFSVPGCLGEVTQLCACCSSVPQGRLSGNRTRGEKAVLSDACSRP